MANPTAPANARSFDPLGAFAYFLYVGVGGFLVFAFAWALAPAVERQNEAACRPLRPEARDFAAPDVVLHDLDGAEVPLSSFLGKTVVLNFWATWCPPCITEWPQVHQLAERLADRDDIVVVAVSIDEDLAVIRPFLEKMAMGETRVVVLRDPTKSLHTQFGTEKLPDTYVIDEAGNVVQAFINARKWGSPTAVQCVESMVDSYTPARNT